MTALIIFLAVTTLCLCFACFKSGYYEGRQDQLDGKPMPKDLIGWIENFLK